MVFNRHIDFLRASNDGPIGIWENHGLFLAPVNLEQIVSYFVDFWLKSYIISWSINTTVKRFTSYGNAFTNSTYKGRSKFLYKQLRIHAVKKSRLKIVFMKLLGKLWPLLRKGKNGFVTKHLILIDTNNFNYKTYFRINILNKMEVSKKHQKGFLQFVNIKQLKN